MRLILGILAAVALLIGIRWLLKSPARWKWIIVAISTLLLTLVALGKAHWIAAVVGAALPFLRKAWLLLQYMPFLTRKKSGFQNSAIPRFESEWLRLEFNIFYRQLDGYVLKGSYKGNRLSRMNEAELNSLLQALNKNDLKGAALLRSYLAQMRMRGKAGSQQSQGQERQQGRQQGFADNQEMTSDEASQILGIEKNASKEEITKAYKILMQRLHPDRGGSNYLAEKINQAKKTLLN